VGVATPSRLPVWTFITNESTHAEHERSRLIFFNGLLWYLETRNWAFEKIRICPMGSHPLDMKMHHYLYLSNLFGSIDLVRDYLRPLDEEAAFHDAVKHGFAGTNKYARQLRNAVIHRGFDPSASGHADGTTVKALCPANVYDQHGGKSYTCTFRYTVELADCCNQIANAAIFEALNRHAFLDPGQHLVSKEETMEAIRLAAVMPDWAKAMAQEAFNNIDYGRVSTEIAATRIKQVKSFLGR
jgi:hypothetical protein